MKEESWSSQNCWIQTLIWHVRMSICRQFLLSTSLEKATCTLETSAFMLLLSWDVRSKTCWVLFVRTWFVSQCTIATRYGNPGELFIILEQYDFGKAICWTVCQFSSMESSGRLPLFLSTYPSFKVKIWWLSWIFFIHRIVFENCGHVIRI